jgi:hypothetical protein
MRSPRSGKPCSSTRPPAPEPGGLGHRLLYSEAVAEGRDSGWWIGPKWVRGIGSRLQTAAEDHLLPDDPEARLELYERSLADMIRLYGPDGGPTAKGRANVAKQLEAMGRLAEARLLWVEVLKAFRKHLGEDHPDTLDVESWLVQNLSSSGMTDATRLGARHLYAARLRVNGPDDKETLWVERLLVSLGDESDGGIA